MKKSLAGILLIVVSLHTFYQAGITFWFYANQSYIIRQLCVNRLKPELECNGKCFLKKKIKEAEQQNEEQAPLQLKQWVETAPCIIGRDVTVLPDIFLQGDFHPAPEFLYSFSLLKDIFHPPDRWRI